MKIKDISTIVNGSTPSTKKDFYWNGNISWITPKDLSLLKARLIGRGERNITKEGYNSCSTTLVPPKTVLLTSRAPIGYVAIAANPLCTNQGFKSIICNESIINPYFLYYWLLTRTQFLQNVAGGSTFKELSKQQLESIEISVPSLEVQQHIVDTIGTIDDAIEKNEEIITGLLKLSDLIYPKDSLGNKLYLGNITNIQTGKLNANEATANGKYPFFTCGKDNLKIDDYAFDGPYIIIAGNGEISVKYYDGKFNAYQRTYCLQPTRYFYSFLKACESNVNNLVYGSQGSVIKFITKPMLENIAIYENTNSEFIEEKLKRIYKLIFSLKEKNTVLMANKNLLLKKYFD